MQCPDCGYISFKQAKDCSSCGFDFKKAATSTASLFRNDSFTVFAVPAKEQESSGAPTAQAVEGVAVVEPPEGSQETPEPESGKFLLNLPDPEEGSSDSPIEVALDEEPVLEITPTPEEDTCTLKINGLNDAPSSEDKVDVEAEPVAPVLDLGDGEISLDLDEDLEPTSPAEEPAPPSAQNDELEIKLEIDDSEGPLTTKSDETPEIEIEDLGLELEGSDSPPDPEKP